MTKAECLSRANRWVAAAEQAHANDAQLGLSANTYARGHLAASIANVYATLALAAPAET